MEEDQIREIRGFKKISPKSLLISGAILYILFIVSDNLLHNSLTPVSAIFDTLGSLGLIILIWGTSEFYISQKVTESKIIAFILSFTTIAIILGILKYSLGL